MYKPKVFGLGLSRTGSSTLGKSLKMLGYNHMSLNGLAFLKAKCGDLSYLDQTVKKHESFDHHPFPYFYKYLDERFSGSKFILTTRKSSEIWFNSMVKGAENTPTEKLWMNLLVFGFMYPHQEPSYYISYYNKHNQDIRNHFKGRTKDFLEVCWEKGDGWEKLCNFLGHKIPDVELPHLCKSNIHAKKYYQSNGEGIEGKLIDYDLRQIRIQCSNGRIAKFKTGDLFATRKSKELYNPRQGNSFIE